VNGPPSSTAEEWIESDFDRRASDSETSSISSYRSALEDTSPQVILNSDTEELDLFAPLDTCLDTEYELPPIDQDIHPIYKPSNMIDILLPLPPDLFHVLHGKPISSGSNATPSTSNMKIDNVPKRMPTYKAIPLSPTGMVKYKRNLPLPDYTEDISLVKRKTGIESSFCASPVPAASATVKTYTFIQPSDIQIVRNPSSEIQAPTEIPTNDNRTVSFNTDNLSLEVNLSKYSFLGRDTPTPDHRLIPIVKGNPYFRND